MFGLRYVVNELRRRLGRTILTAFGLASGVGLVIGIIGVSQGLDEAQSTVLAPLEAVGTDILVTRVAASVQGSPSPVPSASLSPRQGGGGFFGGGFGQGGGGPGGQGTDGASLLNQEDAAEVLNENSNVVTDLSKLGEPGARFTRDFFLSATLLSFPEESIQTVKAIDGVSDAVGGLTQLASHQEGKVPRIVASITTGGEELTSTSTPDPPTAKEREAIFACLQKQGFDGGRPRPTPSPGDGDDGGRGTAFLSCMPERFQSFTSRVLVPTQTIRQVVDPPSTDITARSYTAAGIDPSNPKAGLVTTEQLTSGRWLTPGSSDEVLVNVAYANKSTLKVGDAIPINGTTYSIVGLVNPTLTGSTADLYFPLSTLQSLAGKVGRVTQVLVKATDASKVDAVAAAIKAALPGAEVVTTKSLADQVTGSLADAQKVASRLGGALGVIVLAAAFTIAVLLTLASIAKRVREIGTLRAIGWSKGRVVRQILGETIGIGALGGILGIAVGIGVAVSVGVFSPTLQATTTGVPGFGSSQLSGLFGAGAQSVRQTSTLSLSAPVRPMTLVLGVAFAILGGVLAGAVGGWRAARLSPAEALRTVG